MWEFLFAFDADKSLFKRISESIQISKQLNNEYTVLKGMDR